MTARQRWAYLVVSAAPPVLRIGELVHALDGAGWSVCVIATPTAASWIDLDELAAQTGCVTRVHARPPRMEKSLPRADVVVAAPVTFNSINKWAAGFSDTLALGVLNEMLGAGIPIIAAPTVKPVLRRHPAYADSVGRLADAGVTMLDPDSVTRRAEDGLATLDWAQITAAVHEATRPVAED